MEIKKQSDSVPLFLHRRIHMLVLLCDIWNRIYYQDDNMRFNKLTIYFSNIRPWS